MDNDRKMREDIKQKMLEGWSYNYSCGLLGIHADLAARLLREDKEFKLWVSSHRRKMRNGWTEIYR